MEHRRFVWMRKEVRKDDELVEQKEKKVDDERLMRKNRHRHAKHIRDHYHKKKNSGGGFPGIPVHKNGEETTVMIEKHYIPTKYSYVSLCFHIPSLICIFFFIMCIYF